MQSVQVLVLDIRWDLEGFQRGYKADRHIGWREGGGVSVKVEREKFMAKFQE